MNLHVGNCTRAVLCAVSLIGALSAADSVFVDQAFNGRWQSPFEVFVIQQISDAEGLRLINSIGEPQFAEKNCPGVSERREFYSASSPDVLLYGCTNGNTLVGRFTDKSNQGQADTGSFASNPIPDPSGPGGSASPSFDVTINSKVSGTIRFKLTYLGSGLATPLAYVKDQVTLGTATPLSGASLLASEPLPTFKAQVTFKLYTANLASVVLVLTDKQGVLGTSASVSVAKTDASSQLTFSIAAPAPSRPVQGPLTLIAEIRSPSGTVLAASKPAKYSIYVPASNVRFYPDFLFLQPGFQPNVPIQSTIRVDGLRAGAALRATKQREGAGTEWLTVGAATASGGVECTADPAKLVPGVYWNAIRMQWDGGEQSIPIVFHLYGQGQKWLWVTPRVHLFESTTSGTNEVRNTKVWDFWNPTIKTNFVVTGEAPSLVQVGPAYSPPDWPFLSSTEYFSIKLSREALREVGSRSTMLKVSAPGFYTEPVLVATRIRSAAEPLVPVLSQYGVELGERARMSEVVRVDCSFPGERGYVQPVEVSVVTSDGRDWLRTSGGTYCSTEFTGSVTITLDRSVLPPTENGWLGGYVSFRIGDVVRTVRVSVIIRPVAAPGSTGAARSADAGCAPTRARVIETMLPGGFSMPAGAPVALLAQLTDDCGNVLTDGSVTARFSNGDRPIQLRRGAAGQFSATWQPLNPLLRTNVTLVGDSGELKPDTLEIEGEITPEETPAPSLEPGGIVNSLDPVAGAPVSPGMLVQVNGHNLAAEAATAEGDPLPTSFQGVEVRMGDALAPIVSVSESRLIVQVPAELEVDRNYPVLVSVNGNYAAPQEIYLVAAQPAAAASPDGRLIAEHSDGKLITAASPAQPGETVVLHLVGMGATIPPVPSGAASPVLPMAASQIQPHVTINGEAAEVLFSGLTPGKVGLYQIRLLVPPGAADGDLVVAISQGAAEANAARLPVGRGLSPK